MAKRIQKTIQIDASILVIIDKYKYENNHQNLSDAFNGFIVSTMKEAEVKTENVEIAKEIKEMKKIISALVSILKEKGEL